MKRIAVIHQLPLEYYPPATNLLDCLSRNEDLAIDVFTSSNVKGRPDWENPRVRITRFPFPRLGRLLPLRLLDYFRFILGTTWRLVIRRPRAVIYIEPHSALPVWLYKRVFNPRAAILHHCHEYYPPESFQRPGMRLVRLAHTVETRYLYGKAVWISQTNPDRVRLFLQNHPELDASKVHSLPNHPPSSWQGTRNTAWNTPPLPLRCIYVGSISLEDTYIRELCEWIERCKESVELDIWAYNVSPETHEWLTIRARAVDGIQYHDCGLPYEDLPRVLAGYHVGLILYRGNTANFIWNAPNKLFEYLACGLDVWYPPIMRGIAVHEKSKSFPKVLPVDFEDLDSIDLEKLTDRKSLPEDREHFDCNETLSVFETQLEKI